MFSHIVTVLAGNITNLPEGLFWALMSFLMVCTVNAFSRMSRRLHQAKKIANVPTAKIRSASQGYVELSGIAKLMESPLIVSPLTGKSCVWYRYKVEEKINTSLTKDNYSSEWRGVKQGLSEELFLLEDKIVRCIIDLDDADVYICYEKIWHQRHARSRRRYTEQLIRDGNPLYGVGFFKTVAEIEQQQTRQQVALMLKQWKQDFEAVLHRFDHDNDGQNDANEWQQARQAAVSEIGRKQALKIKEALLNVMIRTDVSDQAYILSSEPEAVLIRQYHWRALRVPLSVFISGSLSVCFFNIRFGL